MPQLERIEEAEVIQYRPKPRDSAGRTKEVADSMDLPPREGARPKFQGSREYVALGGNKPMPPPISVEDEQYAEGVAEAYAQYPAIMYHKALKREKDANGKPIPNGEAFPLSTADEVNPGYPIPFSMGSRDGVPFVKGKIEGISDARAIKAQHLFKTRFIPLDWDPQNPKPIDLALCKKQEAELAKAGWVRNPNDLNLPKPKTVEEESEE